MLEAGLKPGERVQGRLCRQLRQHLINLGGCGALQFHLLTASTPGQNIFDLQLQNIILYLRSFLSPAMASNAIFLQLNVRLSKFTSKLTKQNRLMSFRMKCECTQHFKILKFQIVNNDHMLNARFYDF